MLGILIAALQSFSDTPNPRPPELMAMDEARNAIQGRIAWSATDKSGKRFHFVSRYAENGDMIFENRGDDDGWTLYNAGQPDSRFPQIYLMNADGTWHYQETSSVVKYWKNDSSRESETRYKQSWLPNIRDIRAVGTASSSFNISMDKGFSAIWQLGESGEAPAWTKTPRDDGRVEITARFPSGHRTTWLLNRKKGWNAEKVVHEYRGNVTNVMECDLEEFDGVWLPRATRYLDGRGEVQDTIRIETAELNSRHAKYSLADLGVEAGCNISEANFKSSGSGLIWNGDAITNEGEFFAEVKAGNRKLGPRILRIRELGYGISPYQTPEQLAVLKAKYRKMEQDNALVSHEALWDKYVREFIRQFRLDSEQAQIAWQVHAECLNAADRYLSNHKDEFATLDAELKKQPSNDTRATEIQSKIEKLREPINQIFIKQLQPRLEKLPTRAQRKAAEAEPASKPTVATPKP